MTMSITTRRISSEICLESKVLNTGNRLSNNQTKPQTSPSPLISMEQNSTPPPTVDQKSGFCRETKVFHSLRPPLPLPPEMQDISVTSYAFTALDDSAVPTRTAFIDSSTSVSLSYRDFRSQVVSLSSALKRHPFFASFSLSKGHVAFILSPTSVDIPVVYFALLSVGVIVSPSNPASSPEEISYQFHLTKPSVVFATYSTVSLLPPDAKNLVLLDSTFFRSLLTFDSNDLNGKDLVGISSAYAVPVRQSDPAVVLYSSGTTGRVKAVELTHRNFISQLAVIKSMQRPRKRDSPPVVQLLTAPLFHSYGFLFCIKAIMVREAVVLMTERFKVGRLLRDIDKYRVTNLTAAPPVVVAMLREMDCGDKGSGGGGKKYDLRSLEGVSCGGAPIADVLIRRFQFRFPNISFVQAYGLTETTAGIFRPAGLEETTRVGSCGRLVSNCQAKIVDPATGSALSPGEQGELWVRGPNIMKGYLRDEEATAATLDGEGWLKTGDLCYIDNDGFLFVVDRLKELIKHKGYQVAPAELEHLLHKHQGIIEAAVVPYPDEEAGEVPVAFVVRKPGLQLDEADIMKFVSKQVAPYKKIRRVSFVNTIPKNAAGKILRKDLSKLALSNSKL